VAEAERTAGAVLTSEQRMAVRVLLQQRVSLLQGGAGTGKTTSMRVFVAAWQLLHGRVEAAALSGKAALKLAEGAGLDAITIAQLMARMSLRAALEADGKILPTEDYPRSKAGEATLRLPRFTPETMLMLDEASMIDIANLRRLLQLLPDGAGILLVGDVHQLPPVGIGQVFHDLVAAQQGVVELTTILRQSNDNPLLEAAAAVRSGTVPALPTFQGAGLGAQWEECGLNDVSSRLSAVRQRLAHDADVLVLCARKTTVRQVCYAEMARRQGEGAAGVPLGPLCAWIAIGDPVMMAANHYKHGLANGQLGRITALDPVQVLWDGADQPFEVTDEYRADVVSAWAVTCHKSQGSEAQRVVIGLDSKRMLTRQWLYTAITRAREQAVLVGPANLLELAVRQVSERTTLLSRLTANSPRSGTE
jgi:exodeoxyribonuclease V alpha subunit